MPKKGAKLTRRVASRAPQPRFVVFCEGKNTEPRYLEAFKAAYPRSLFDIEIVDAAGVPATLLKKALERKREIQKAAKKDRSFAENDRIWIVFDKDEHPLVNQTINSCKDNKIGVGYSNPCFEIWLVLHEEDYDKPDCRKTVQKRCEDVILGYDCERGKAGNFLRLIPKIEQAERRAELQQQRRIEEGSAMGVPSTTFFELTRSLRGLDPQPNPA